MGTKETDESYENNVLAEPEASLEKENTKQNSVKKNNTSRGVAEEQNKQALEEHFRNRDGNKKHETPNLSEDLEGGLLPAISPNGLHRNSHITSRPGAYAIPGLGTRSVGGDSSSGNFSGEEQEAYPVIQEASTSAFSHPKTKQRNQTRLALLFLILAVALAVVLAASLSVSIMLGRGKQGASALETNLPNINQTQNNPGNTTYLPQHPGTDVPSQSPSSQQDNSSSAVQERLPAAPYGFMGGCFFCGEQFFWSGDASSADLGQTDSTIVDSPAPTQVGALTAPPSVSRNPSKSPSTAPPTVSNLPSATPSESSNPTSFPTQMPTVEVVHWLYRSELSLSALDILQDVDGTETAPIVFGVSSALTQEWMVLGSLGAVFVYRREYDNNGNNRAIQFHQKLVAFERRTLESPPHSNSDSFGLTVKTDGNRMVVGATLHSNPVGQQTGAAYVFEFQEDTEMWVETATLMAPVDGRRTAVQFGYALAISGNTIAVGECSTVDSRVWVFDLEGGEWVITQWLDAGSDGDFSAFGCELAMDTDTLLVGAPTQLYSGANNTNVACGSVHVFAETFGLWNMTQVLAPGNCPQETMGFGSSLAIDHDTMVIGAPLYGPGYSQQEGHGSFFIYELDVSSGLWEFRLWAKDDTPKSNHRLGTEVAIDAETIAVGAQWTRSTSSGRVSLYTRQGLGWGRQHTVYSPSPISGEFGSQLALYNNTLVATDSWSKTVYAFVSTVVTPTSAPTSTPTDLPTSPATSITTFSGTPPLFIGGEPNPDWNTAAPTDSGSSAGTPPLFIGGEPNPDWNTAAPTDAGSSAGTPPLFIGGDPNPNWNTAAPTSSPVFSRDWPGFSVRRPLMPDMPCIPFDSPGGFCSNCGSMFRESTGCEIPECRCHVCVLDPYCCEVLWDGICSDSARSVCFCI